jgi:hypothetical protein
VLGIVLGVICLLSLYWTITGERRMTRRVMLTAAAVLGLIVAASMAKIAYLVIYQAGTIDGPRLLETAFVIWVCNVILFAVAYHWIGEGEFVFPRSDGAATAKPLVFLDFIFLSFTTATAFSPTDTPPLTTRARMYMMLESGISLATIAIAAARAINILK